MLRLALTKKSATRAQRNADHAHHICQPFGLTLYLRHDLWGLALLRPQGKRLRFQVELELGDSRGCARLGLYAAIKAEFLGIDIYIYIYTHTYT